MCKRPSGLLTAPGVLRSSTRTAVSGMVRLACCALPSAHECRSLMVDTSLSRQPVSAAAALTHSNTISEYSADTRPSMHALRLRISPLIAMSCIYFGTWSVRVKEALVCAYSCLVWVSGYLNQHQEELMSCHQPHRRHMHQVEACSVRIELCSPANISNENLAVQLHVLQSLKYNLSYTW